MATSPVSSWAVSVTGNRTFSTITTATDIVCTYANDCRGGISRSLSEHEKSRHDVRRHVDENRRRAVFQTEEGHLTYLAEAVHGEGVRAAISDEENCHLPRVSFYEGKLTSRTASIP